MDEMMARGAVAPEGMEVAAIGEKQLQEFMQVLQQYKAGKNHTEQRIISSENWWKLRNTQEEQKAGATREQGFTSRSGWLHNVIVSKHADAMAAYPEPNILPREVGDRGEAVKLSAIIPCVLEQNNFEDTYSDVMWQKLKTGTGVYKVIWDQSRLNGLGDIRVECVNLLNIFWEPGVKDIQKSKYFFHAELHDKDDLRAAYPELADKLKGQSFMATKFLYDDSVDTSNKATVIEVYYKKIVNGRSTLQYCRYVEDVVLFATENAMQPIPGRMPGQEKPPMSVSGLYDHGLYPYVFDVLYPIEGSPCGYGFVDLCRNPQTEIDLLKTAFVKNARVGAVPRYFSRVDGNVNEEQFLDLEQALVKVSGNVDEATLRRIEHNSLDGNYIAVLDRTIDELRQTSGNTETSTGSTSSGVTAASAIAALQEASGKGSKDSTKTAYRAYTKIVNLCIELIRQFYDMPRQFRIVGQYGAQQFISYTNGGIQPQDQGVAFGQHMGFRLPVFDVKVSAQKKNVYTKVSQNELALQLFKMGFFNPQMSVATQALTCLEIMDFDGKDEIMQKISKNANMMEKLMQYMQWTLQLASRVQPQAAEMIAQDIMQTFGGSGGMPQMGGSNPELMQAYNISGGETKEHGIVENARSRSNEASQPDGGKVIGGEKK